MWFIWRWGFKGNKLGTWYDRCSILIGRLPECSLSFSGCLHLEKTKRGHDNKMVICNQEESAHQKQIMLAPWSWTSSLRHCEKINFCYLNHLVCGILLWQTNTSNKWDGDFYYLLFFNHPTCSKAFSHFQKESFPFPSFSNLEGRSIKNEQKQNISCRCQPNKWLLDKGGQKL